jgi:hypothetical protein
MLGVRDHVNHYLWAKVLEFTAESGEVSTVAANLGHGRCQLGFRLTAVE